MKTTYNCLYNRQELVVVADNEREAQRVAAEEFGIGHTPWRVSVEDAEGEYKDEVVNNGPIMVDILCPACGETFSRRRVYTHLHPGRGAQYSTCGRVCATRMNRILLGVELDTNLIQKSVLREYNA